MSLLKPISQLALYGLCILGSLDLFSGRDHLYQLRAQVPMLAEWNITPSWSILVMTSHAFIWSAPVIPILGIITAWKLRNNSKFNLPVLARPALMTIIREFFVFFNEPTEGQLLCC